MLHRIAAHLLALTAALAIALGATPFAAPMVHASAQGFEVVICADGEARTVIIGEDGTPLDPARDETCPVCCPCTLASGSGAPVPPEGLPADRALDAGAAVFPAGFATMHHGRAACLFQARGPPMEATAC